MSNTESEKTKLVQPNLKRKSTLPLKYQTSPQQLHPSRPSKAMKQDRSTKQTDRPTKQTMKQKPSRMKKRSVKKVQDDMSTTFTDDSSLSDVPIRPTPAKSQKLVEATSEKMSSQVPNPITSAQVSTLHPNSTSSTQVSGSLQQLHSHQVLEEILGKTIVMYFLWLNVYA